MVLDLTLDAALLFVVNREGVTTSSRAGTDLDLLIVIIEPLLYISVAYIVFQLMHVHIKHPRHSIYSGSTRYHINVTVEPEASL